jgi:hypothetical protein
MKYPLLTNPSDTFPIQERPLKEISIIIFTSNLHAL